MLKSKLSYFALIISLVNLILYYIPFYLFVFDNVNIKSINGIKIVVGLTILALLLNALVFYITLYLLRRVGKWLLVLFFIINSVALYFINTYGVIIDKTMIGNVLNTNFEESSSFFSFTLIAYLIFLGVIPGIFLLKTKVIYVRIKEFLAYVSLTLVFLLIFIYINSGNWLWIDKNSKTLGALTMPWSYVINTVRFYNEKYEKNKEQITLPNAKIRNDKKSVVVLVIGESARSGNFSLYGYQRDTNPLLSKINNIHVYKAKSCATYTTAGIKCILEHKETDKLYEILPNYLYRNGVEVVWRTTNWGEPTIRIKKYQKRKDLERLCEGDDFKYDEILLSGLKEQILSSKKNKIFIVLHTSTSHGPTYYKKYPPRFNIFTPVCKSVELAKCTQQELINAYDNTIVYTDYILANLISILKQLDDFNSCMIYISDHGESLGENNLYMHGIPASIAPKEQLEIPFIVWVSDNSPKPKDTNQVLSQHYVFHSIIDFLSIDSPVYNKNLSLFNKQDLN